MIFQFTLFSERGFMLDKMFWQFQESHAQGQNYLTIGNGAGPFSMYRGNSNSDETPKTSRKRKRHNLITNKTPPLQQQVREFNYLQAEKLAKFK